MKKFIRKIKNRSTLFTSQAFVDEHSTVGEFTYIGYNSFVTKAQIGRYCSIANNVSIGPGEHNIDTVSSNTLFYADPYSKLTEKDITIGHDVWIGVNSVIRRGVTIGNGAVIGANSFVNTDIKALTEIIKEVVGYKGEIRWDSSKPDGTPRKLLDSTRIKSTGWAPIIPLKEGIASAYQDYLKRYS